MLVTVAPPPLTVLVVRLVLEAHGDPAALIAPKLFPEPVVELPGPLASEKVLYGLTPLEEFVAVAPLRVLGVGKSYLLRVAGVPGVLGHLNLLARRLLGERRHRRSDLLLLFSLLHPRIPLLLPNITIILPSVAHHTERSFYQQAC